MFRTSDLYLVALLWKMICNLGDPMCLRHPVSATYSAHCYEKHQEYPIIDNRKCTVFSTTDNIKCTVFYEWVMSHSYVWHDSYWQHKVYCILYNLQLTVQPIISLVYMSLFIYIYIGLVSHIWPPNSPMMTAKEPYGFTHFGRQRAL